MVSRIRNSAPSSWMILMRRFKVKLSAVVMCSICLMRPSRSGGVSVLTPNCFSFSAVRPGTPQPTVVRSPVLWPATFSIFQSMKQVVVLPLVPVTPMTRSFLPGKP